MNLWSSRQRMLLLPLTLLSCSQPKVYPQHPLASEILSPRPGHDGKLTNQACKSYDFDGKCLEWHTVDYDVSDQEFQKEANLLGITCRIGGKRYKVCMNEKDVTGKEMNGFCRVTYDQSCFLFVCGKKTRKVDFFPIDPYQPVLNSEVRCQNEDLYPNE